MNKKTIISLLLALLVLALLVFFFFKNKGKTTEVVTTNTKATTEQPTNKEVEDVNTVKPTTFKLGDYGDLKSVIKTNLSDADKKALQKILNERSVEMSKYQTLINIAKNNPTTDAGAINGAIEKYNAAMAKFDKVLKPYMTTEKFSEYKKVMSGEAKEVSQKAYTK